MVAVTYYCPHCGTIAELERDAYLADKSVTPYPLEGWEYATPDEEYEAADGVRFICGEGESPRVSFRRPPSEAGSTRRDDGEVGCGEPFYLSFVRFEAGEEVEPEPPAAFVEIGAGTGPRGPRTPRGPSGPDLGLGR